MKVGLVYTSTTPRLIELVEKEVREKLKGDVILTSYQDPSILSDIREAGSVTKRAALKLTALYRKAAEEDVDAVLNICSSVGLAADAAKPWMEFIKVPLIRIDDKMCEEAVKAGNRIGVMATLKTTLEPTKQTLIQAGKRMEKPIVLQDGLIDGAFDLSEEEFRQVLIKKAEELSSEVDVIVLAQGSMAFCEKAVQKGCKKPVFSSPAYGAMDLQEVLNR